MWLDVLLMFYLAPSNTMRLTYYILPIHQFSKKPRRNHTGKTAGMPVIRPPPPK